MIAFPTTQWDSVADAADAGSPHSHAALAELCRDFWYPVYALIRSHGCAPEETADLTQDFFGRLMEGPLLKVADPSKGRFRDLLRKDCRFFLSDCRDRGRALKREEASPQLSLDVDDAERRYGLEPSDHLDPERRFERAWAIDLLSPRTRTALSRGRRRGPRRPLPSVQAVLDRRPERQALCRHRPRIGDNFKRTQSRRPPPSSQVRPRAAGQDRRHPRSPDRDRN